MSDEKRERVNGAEEGNAAAKTKPTPDPTRDERAAKRRDPHRPGSDACHDPEARLEAEELNSVRPARMRRGPAQLVAAEAGETRPRKTKEGEQPSSPRPLTNAGREESDPGTVQQRVRDRFVQDGGRFYFRDGRLAFRDHGRKLSTPGDNVEVIATLIDIARWRGWQEVMLEGTQRFCRYAWRQGRLAGLVVRGYAPSAAEHAGMIRALSSQERPPAARDAPALEPPEPHAPVEPDPGTQPSPAPKGSEKFIVGKLLVHGLAPYRSNPRREMSYFVRIDTNAGPRTVWAKDLMRAMEQSRSQPKVGDTIVMRRVPSACLPVRSRGHDAEAPARNEPDRLIRRQGWVIEKRDFFEARAKAAETLRNPAIEPREGVRRHPELAGSYLNLRAAELAAQGMGNPENEKQFVEAVRNGMADSIARGDPFPQARLRVPPEGHPNLERGHPPVRA